MVPAPQRNRRAGPVAVAGDADAGPVRGGGPGGVVRCGQTSTPKSAAMPARPEA
jgi:hypothetical protein